MADRDDKGRLLPGHSVATGRPADSGKQYVKDMCWASMNKIAWLIFSLPKADMELWIASNRHTLSLAEEAYLRAACGGLPHEETIEDGAVKTYRRADLSVIEAILDRIIGKTLKIDSGQTERDPVIERLYQLSPGNVKKEIDRLIKVRGVMLDEQRSIEAANKKG